MTVVRYTVFVEETDGPPGRPLAESVPRLDRELLKALHHGIGPGVRVLRDRVPDPNGRAIYDDPVRLVYDPFADDMGHHPDRSAPVVVLAPDDPVPDLSAPPPEAYGPLGS